MSKWKPGKLYGFGQLCKEKGVKLEGEDWFAWIRKEKIDAVELQYILDGYAGDAFKLHYQEAIIPFSPFKGKRLTQMKTSYLHYLLTKDWLDKWGDLRLHIEYLLKERAKEEKEKQDILSETIRQLK